MTFVYIYFVIGLSFSLLTMAIACMLDIKSITDTHILEKVWLITAATVVWPYCMAKMALIMIRGS